MLTNRIKVIFVRHGETKWNNLGRLNSFTDIGLNQQGQEQCKAICNKIIKFNISKIISSTLLRAKETAMIIGDNLKLPINYDERLIETNFGKFEGDTLESIMNSDLAAEYKNWRNEESPIIPDTVESYAEVEKRATSFLQDLLSEKGNILVISHSVFLRILISHCVLRINSSKYRRLKMDNCSINIIELESLEYIRLEKLNEVA